MRDISISKAELDAIGFNVPHQEGFTCHPWAEEFSARLINAEQDHMCFKYIIKPGRDSSKLTHGVNLYTVEKRDGKNVEIHVGFDTHFFVVIHYDGQPYAYDNLHRKGILLADLRDNIFYRKEDPDSVGHVFEISWFETWKDMIVRFSRNKFFSAPLVSTRMAEHVPWHGRPPFNQP